MKDILNEYIEALKNNGYAENTISGKQMILKRFIAYLEENNVNDLNKVEPFIIDSFKAHLKKAGLRNVSVRNNVKRIREFFLYLEVKHIISESPFPKFKKKAFNPENYPAEFRQHYSEYLSLKEYEAIPYNSKKKLRLSLNRFFTYLAENNITKMHEVKKEYLSGFIKYLVDLKDYSGKTIYKVESVNRIISDLKPFIQYLSKKGIYAPGFSSHIKYLRNVHELSRNILTRKELAALFNIRCVSLYGFMMKAIFIIQYAMGLRINELLNIKVTDIDYEKKEVIIYESKTKKYRAVQIGEVGINYLRIFINNVRDKVCYDANTSEKVFMSYLEGVRLNENTVNRYLKSFCKLAGITKKITCHCFRHSYGSHLLENGLGIKEVSDLLGHTDLASTERYTRLSPERLRKTINACHPRERDRLCHV